jgi:flagellar protein FliS
MNPYLKQYQQTQIDTAPKEQILLMLYDGAVRFLHQAKAGFAEKNIEKIHNNIIKTQNIITEFESTLDMEHGGAFAQNLFDLYEYLNNRLVEANMKKREDYLDEVIKHMTELRDTWREAVKKFKAEGGTLLDNEVDKYSADNVSSYDDEDMGEYI